LLPKERQSLFFSATMPAPIAELAAQFLYNPERVAVAPPSTTVERVEQAVIHVDQKKKQDLLHALLKDKTIKRALVFTRTKHGADRVVEKLASAGFEAEAIHGNKNQGQRTRALDAFKKGHARLLIATEIAARGIDVDDVSHVINFDLPNVPEQYVHRIGRTARAGAGGKAISLVDEASALYLEAIEKYITQKIHVAWAEDDLYVSEVKPTAEERRRFSEERRARLDARRGTDRGRGRGGRPERRPPDRPRPAPERAASAPEHPRPAPEHPRSTPEDASGGPSGASDRPRRRRGHRGGKRPDQPPGPSA